MIQKYCLPLKTIRLIKLSKNIYVDQWRPMSFFKCHIGIQEVFVAHQNPVYVLGWSNFSSVTANNKDVHVGWYCDVTYLITISIP